MLGDCSVGRPPAVQDERVQVVCYPGAQLVHVYQHVKDGMPISSEVMKVLLSFGINNRKHASIALLERTLRGSWEQWRKPLQMLKSGCL